MKSPPKTDALNGTQTWTEVILGFFKHGTVAPVMVVYSQDEFQMSFVNPAFIVKSREAKLLSIQ